MNHDDTVVVRVSNEQQMPPVNFEKHIKSIRRAMKKSFPHNNVVVIPDTVVIEIL